MKIGIIGGGAWGTALAIGLSKKFQDILIYSIENEVRDSINQYHTNTLYLEGFLLPSHIKGTSNIADLKDYKILLIATPTQFIRDMAIKIKPFCENSKILICSKGIEIKNKQLISQILEYELGHPENIGVLTGPSFATDLAKELPTALLLALPNIEEAKKLATQFSSNVMRIYYSDDVMASQIGGAVKNVLAIAGGIIKGADLGNNALAAMLTRGLKDIVNLTLSLGGKAETVYGLSGLGDLLLTATSEKSRNFSLGLTIGEQGKYSGKMEGKLSGIAEGFYTTKALYEIMQERQINMPICKQVYEICYEGKNLREVVQTLMQKPISEE
ncbi:NAD(P)-dependent glycerol-3-phosphate dehydrogenase [Candidatus Hepatincolaceae symbiont of Richtersius coronifer]